MQTLATLDAYLEMRQVDVNPITITNTVCQVRATRTGGPYSLFPALVSAPIGKRYNLRSDGSGQ